MPGIVQDLEIERPLRWEMLVEHWLCDACGVGDVAHRRHMKTSLREYAYGNIEKLATPQCCGKAGGHRADTSGWLGLRWASLGLGSFFPLGCFDAVAQDDRRRERHAAKQ